MERLTCSYCKLLITGKYVEHGSKFYHENCYFLHIAKKCVICEKVILGKAVKDYWGNVYHEEHLDKLHTCEYCSRLIDNNISEGGTVYPDGRHICNICKKSAIDNNTSAEYLLHEVTLQLEKLGITLVNTTIPLSLIDRKHLKKISTTKGETTGFTHFESTMVNKKIHSFKIQIYILSGLPQINFIATAAHELMHAWIYLNCPAGSSPLMVEGSCNLAAYLTLLHYKSPEADYVTRLLIESKDPVYGKGFRLALERYQGTGAQGWLEYIKAHKKF